MISIETKLFASKKILNFIEDMDKRNTSQIFSVIKEQHSRLSSEAFVDFLTDFEKVALSRSSEIDYVKPIILDFGTVVRNEKEYTKNAFVIDIKKIIELYWADEDLKNVLCKSSVGGKAEIKLALYHDEISLTNPIGNFCTRIISVKS